MRRRLRKLKILKVFDPTPKHMVKSHHFFVELRPHKHTKMIYYCFNYKFVKVTPTNKVFRPAQS